MSLRILILGVNGFIGSHLLQSLLNNTTHEVIGLDIHNNYVREWASHKHFAFHQLDLLQSMDWLESVLPTVDVVLPLVAIATPATYVQDPLRIFELDFEANLAVIRLCVKHKKRVIFPSTSEVYGMCPDAAFDEETSNLVYGPINKPRWIYATCKQLLDRVIHAYGEKGELSYTLFRPFNWIGPRLDDIHNPKPGGARVVTQFLGQIMRGQPIQLVDGGAAQRCFTDINDAIAGLLTIIDNPEQCADKQIFNLGNPDNNHSIRTLAEWLLEIARQTPEFRDPAQRVQIESVSSQKYYGAGYQDVSSRVPTINRARNLLGWRPKLSLQDSLQAIVNYYAEQIRKERLAETI